MFTDISIDFDKFEDDSTVEDLRAFMETHEQNAEAYDELKGERDELAEDFEDAQETLSEIQSEFAPVVAEASPLFSEAEVKEKFTAVETVEKALDAFDLQDDEEEESEGSFEEDNPPQSPGPDKDETEFVDQLNDIPGVIVEDK